jgi:hypothetical protein
VLPPQLGAHGEWIGQAPGTIRNALALWLQFFCPHPISSLLFSLFPLTDGFRGQLDPLPPATSSKGEGCKYITLYQANVQSCPYQKFQYRQLSGAYRTGHVASGGWSAWHCMALAVAGHSGAVGAMAAARLSQP